MSPTCYPSSRPQTPKRTEPPKVTHIQEAGFHTHVWSEEVISETIWVLNGMRCEIQLSSSYHVGALLKLLRSVWQNYYLPFKTSQILLSTFCCTGSLGSGRNLSILLGDECLGLMGYVTRPHRCLLLDAWVLGCLWRWRSSPICVWVMSQRTKHSLWDASTWSLRK